MLQKQKDNNYTFRWLFYCYLAETLDTKASVSFKDWSILQAPFNPRPLPLPFKKLHSRCGP